MPDEDAGRGCGMGMRDGNSGWEFRMRITDAGWVFVGVRLGCGRWMMVWSENLG